jgi:hypothetical protein
MIMLLRLFIGVAGLALLAGTVALVLDLLAMDHNPSVLLAGYMAIGGILLGGYFLFYAITGDWRPDLTNRIGSR